MCLKIFPFLLLVALMMPTNYLLASGFVEVDGNNFLLEGKPYQFIGTNFWYGANLGARGAGGDRLRLTRELDKLEALGVRNLRVMAASEGPDSEPYRMVPSMQPAPGKYNQDVMRGLDFLLSEMKKRDMKAVMCLGNMWHWSGGFAQYVSWATNSKIPYPKDDRFRDFENYAAKFYTLKTAKALYENHVRTILTRVNSVTGEAYKDDSTIMAWQLANEPRGNKHKKAYLLWVKRSAALIKATAPKQLTSIGSEGFTPYESAGTYAKAAHEIPEIDYITFHIWVQNWGWYNPKDPASYPSALKKVKAYFKRHTKLASDLGKPAVLEEFGIARDNNNHAPKSPTSIRDIYYREVFKLVEHSIDTAGRVSGVNFWAWAGEGRSAHWRWQPGDAFIGDPPHESQGWYSVFNSDISTMNIIRDYSVRFSLRE